MKRAVSISVLLLCGVGLLIVIAHIAGLRPPLGMSAPPGREWFSEQFEAYRSHTGLAFLHVLPAAAFLATAPFQFWVGFRQRRLALHRALGFVFIASTLIIAVSGFLLAVIMPFAGWPETLVSMIASGLIIYFVLQALRSIKGKRVLEHREWMIRTFALGSGVVTMRAVNSALFPMGLVEDRTLFWITLWLGFGINLIVAEVWIRRTHK